MSSYKPLCPYCLQAAKLVGGEAIYPNRPDLFDLKFWQCAPCEAYVGCHKKGALIASHPKKKFSNGTVPLGRLANAELRASKSRAHWAFDPLWKGGPMTRTAAYRWLADELGIPLERCHIGEFDVNQCRRVASLALAKRDAIRSGESVHERALY